MGKEVGEIGKRIAEVNKDINSWYDSVAAFVVTGKLIGVFILQLKK